MNTKHIIKTTNRLFPNLLVLLFTIHGLLSVPTLSAQQNEALTINNTIYSPLVKTVIVREATSPWAPAIIRLNSTDELKINFDLTTLDNKYLYYTIEHLNADGSRSSMNDSEFLDGFNDNPINEARPSFNTFMNYTHYNFSIPNENVKFRLSGNYQVKVYEDGNKDNPLFTSSFGVSEEQVFIQSTITTRTDIDYQKSHQQLEVKVGYPEYSINNPASELKLVIWQNSRTDNCVQLSQPMILSGKEIVYRNLPTLIFEAGNEFRRFETVSNRYGGLRVLNVRYFNPYYHATIETDKPRNTETYTYDQDQDGRMVVRALNSTDDNLEADYFMTHFTLIGIDPLINGKIYLYGELTNFLLNEQSRMNYNFETKSFEKALPLKQGAYNYQYLFVPHGDKKATTELVEGNFYPTENEYHIRLYHRPFGERYDKLIGTVTVNSNR